MISVVRVTDLHAEHGPLSSRPNSEDHGGSPPVVDQAELADVAAHGEWRWRPLQRLAVVPHVASVSVRVHKHYYL